jgi:hypothetical protein
LRRWAIRMLQRSKAAFAPIAQAAKKLKNKTHN